MSFGYDRLDRIFLNDSKILTAFLYASDDQTLIPQTDINSVTFTVLKPDDDVNTPTVVEVLGEIIADGTGQFIVSPIVNDVEGEYRAYARFSYDEGDLIDLTKTVVVFYDVVDAFERSGPSPADPAVDLCWLKLEDCFDSEFGGPWLRDMTMRVFDKTKLREFAPTVLLQINQTMPYSNYDLPGYPWLINDGAALFAQGLLVETIRHLMRSYTEQPDVMNSPVGFLDRKKYQQAWKLIYDVESGIFDKWLYKWKLREYDITHAAVLLGSKAGRMLPAPMRSRNVGRGF